MMKKLETIIKRSSRNWEKKEEKIHSDLAQKKKNTGAIASYSSSSPVGGSAPLDSVTVGGGVRFDSSLVAGMDETSVWLDG